MARRRLNGSGHVLPPSFRDLAFVLVRYGFSPRKVAKALAVSRTNIKNLVAVRQRAFA